MTQNQISYFKAKEEERHNKVMEQEAKRSNLANEAIQRMNAESTKSHYERSDSETVRSNLVRESQNATSITQNYTKIAQEDRKIAETAKHNRAEEEIAYITANAKAKEAAAKMVTSQAAAEADYARAGLTYAQTGLTDVQAAVEAARVNQIKAQTDQIYVSIPQTVSQTEVNRATRDKIITETSYIPLNTWSNVLRNLGIGGIIK